MVVFVDGHLLRADELAGLAAVAAPLTNELALGRELLNPVEIAVLGDVEVAGRIVDDGSDQPELPRLVPLHAAERAQQSALGRVDQHAIVMGVGHPDGPVGADRHARGFAYGMVGRMPAAQKIAIGVKDLYPGGHIDDVEMVFSIDGHRPGLLQPAIGDAASPPDGLQPSGGCLVAGAALHRRNQGGDKDNPGGSVRTAMEHDAKAVVSLLTPSVPGLSGRHQMPTGVPKLSPPLRSRVDGWAQQPIE